MKISMKRFRPKLLIDYKYEIKKKMPKPNVYYQNVSIIDNFNKSVS